MTDERLFVAGLSAPVEILVDRWGVSHIRAGNTNDLFFAQGFNAARDRLWQIDLWRKRGLGRLAGDFGPGYLAQDRASRLFLYRGDMDAEWASYGPEARDICTSFAAGINAYIDVVEAEPPRVPPEFVALGTRPAKWQPEDVVRIRTHGWTRNVLSEVQRAQVLACATADVDRMRMNLEPDVTPQVAAGLDLRSIPPGVLDAYRLATTPVTFSAERLGAGMADAWRWASVGPDGDVVQAAAGPASNNWAVHGSRTATGRPILANDPHRLHAVPSLRHLVHLTAPDLDVIGAVEPSWPGITIGHNGRAAFGLTLFLGPDQEDLYVYETAGAHPRSYRYRDGWESIRVVEETFDIKGTEPITLPLAFTRHGPVLFEDPARERLFALRTVWSEPGTAPYGAGLLAMRAKSAGEFRDALRRWRVPPVNQVYADRDGTIGWFTAGLVPVRRAWDGLLPVPGDGRFEWEEFVEPDRLPSVLNPPEGFVASANAFNLPEEWTANPPIGYEWDDPSRRDRIREVLTREEAHTVASSRALQSDVVSVPSRRVLHFLRDVPLADSDTAAAVSLLGGWNGEVDAESAPAALFEVWWSRHLRPSILAIAVPDPDVRVLLGPGDVASVLQTLERAATADHLGTRGLLASTLAGAFRECVALMGSDPSGWAWGTLHRWKVSHALSPLALDGSLGAADVGPFATGGSDSTVMKGVYRASDFRVVLGASVRLVIDVGEWDRSVWINTPGQSGDPRSAHYADLAPLWARGEYVPMCYSRDAVGAVTEMTITLTPGEIA